MSKDPLFQHGFTAILDPLVEEIGLIPAAVYGVVRRYCRLENGLCSASRTTLAEKIGVSGATVSRNIKTLCELGYLEDLTPGKRKSTHVYRDTGEGKIRRLLDNKSGAERTRYGQLDNKSGAESSQSGAERTRSGAESQIKREETLEEINNRDYLTDVVSANTELTNVAEPDDFQKHFAFRDAFLRIYNELTGRADLTPAEKNTIVDLANEPGADPAIWEASITEAITNWSGRSKIPPLGRIIEIYRCGGDYQKFSQQKWGSPNGTDGTHTTKEGKTTLRIG